MILTCPECATRYFVDGARLGPAGRTVRCVGCGARWHANSGDLEDETAGQGAPLPRMAQDSEPAAPEVAISAPGDPLPQAFRAATVARRRMRKAVVAGAVWGGLGVFALALLATAAIFRVDVVHMWPRTAGAYAMVGLPVNPTGLAPEGVLAVPGLQNGQLAVVVSGMVRNVETHPREAAPLKVSLLDKNGHALKDVILPATPGHIEPGQARPFKATFIDPPAAGVNVQVEFVLDHAPAVHGAAHAPVTHDKPPRGTPAHGEAGHAPEPAHPAADAHAPAHAPAASHAPASSHAVGPAHAPAAAAHPPAVQPVAARALPADSPYALPPAARPDRSAAQGESHPKPHAPPHG